MKTLTLAVCLASVVLASGTIGCSSSSNDVGGSDSGGPATEASSGEDASSDATTGAEAGQGDSGGGGDSSTGSDGGSASETSTGDAGAGDDSSTGADTGGTTDSGAAADCGSTPTLHPDPAGTLFCGYGTDGGVLDCLTGSKCCLGGGLGGGTFAPEQCAATGSTCTNGGEPDAGGSLAIPIACAQIADCTANGVASAVACCLQGATLPTVTAGCSYPKAKGGTAVVCETGSASPGTCAAGEVQICSSQSDCPSGTVCTPGKWKIYQVGFCL
jgi:hypothetical protein